MHKSCLNLASLFLFLFFMSISHRMCSLKANIDQSVIPTQLFCSNAMHMLLCSFSGWRFWCLVRLVNL